MALNFPLSHPIRKALILTIFAELSVWTIFIGSLLFLSFFYPNEFHFRFPKIIWFNLVALPLYFILFKQRNQLHQFLGNTSPALVSSFITFIPDRQFWTKWILFRLSLFLFIVAFAQPLFGIKKANTFTKSSEIVLALDVSNSMNTLDIDPSLTRLEIAKRATIQLINELQGERIGVLIFAGNAFVQLPITTDYNAAKLFVNEIETKMISNQGTNFEVALNKGINMFSEIDDGKCILMVTDGENHHKIPDATLEALPSENIFFAIVGLGTKQGGLIPENPKRLELGFKMDEKGQPVISKMDKNLVEEMAKKASGIALTSDNPFPNLSGLLTEINGLSKGNLRDLEVDIKQAHYHFPLVLGIAFWMVSQLLPFGKIKQSRV